MNADASWRLFRVRSHGALADPNSFNNSRYGPYFSPENGLIFLVATRLIWPHVCGVVAPLDASTVPSQSSCHGKGASL